MLENLPPAVNAWGKAAIPPSVTRGGADVNDLPDDC
jgi:hypothetical protein